MIAVLFYLTAAAIMKTHYFLLGSLILVWSVLTANSPVFAGFEGAYAPSNRTFVDGGESAAGRVDSSDAPDALTFYVDEGEFIGDYYCVNTAQDTCSLSFTYATQNGLTPAGEFMRYTKTEFMPDNTNITVRGGDQFCFGGMAGEIPRVVTISNFQAHTCWWDEEQIPAEQIIEEQDTYGGALPRDTANEENPAELPVVVPAQPEPVEEPKPAEPAFTVQSYSGNMHASAGEVTIDDILRNEKWAQAMLYLVLPSLGKYTSVSERSPSLPKWSIFHYTASALPGEWGNMRIGQTISKNTDTPSDSFYSRLSELQDGDIIDVYQKQSAWVYKKVQYIVAESYDPAQQSSSLIHSRKKSTLTLQASSVTSGKETKRAVQAKLATKYAKPLFTRIQKMNQKMNQKKDMTQHTSSENTGNEYISNEHMSAEAQPETAKITLLPSIGRKVDKLLDYIQTALPHKIDTIRAALEQKLPQAQAQKSYVAIVIQYMLQELK